MEPGLGEVLTSDGLLFHRGRSMARFPAASPAGWLSLADRHGELPVGIRQELRSVRSVIFTARVPNQVLTNENYAIVVDAAKPLDERLAALPTRAWIDPGPEELHGPDQHNMIKGFDHLGVVEVLRAPRTPLSSRRRLRSRININRSQTTPPPRNDWRSSA